MRQKRLLICKKKDAAASAHFIKANDSVHIIDRRILLKVTWLCEGSRVQSRAKTLTKNLFMLKFTINIFVCIIRFSWPGESYFLWRIIS
ncbi:hypothetical protein DTQ03_07600 [Bacillus subtilis]|nr:hypothetical protein DTQ03_07600 [Bacillus subtilis]